MSKHDLHSWRILRLSGDCLTPTALLHHAAMLPNLSLDNLVPALYRRMGGADRDALSALAALVVAGDAAALIAVAAASVAAA
jgi:hypothetical protein